MRLILLIPLAYLAALWDTSLVDVFRIGRVAPDLLAMLAVLWLLTVPGPRTFLSAGALGLVSDLISPGRIGLAAGCFLLVAYGLGRVRARFALDGLVWQVGAVFGAVTALEVTVAGTYWLLGEAPIALFASVPRAAGVGLYTAGVSLPLLMVVAWTREPSGKRLES